MILIAIPDEWIGRRIPVIAFSSATPIQTAFVMFPASLAASPMVPAPLLMAGYSCKASPPLSVGLRLLAPHCLTSFGWAGDAITHTQLKILLVSTRLQDLDSWEWRILQPTAVDCQGLASQRAEVV